MPTVSITSPNLGSGFSASAVFAPTTIASLVITNGGINYFLNVPTLSITGGGGSGASATAVINTSGNIINTTNLVAGTGFTSVPNVIITYGCYTANY